ncbi:hypothetical protein [Streptomyces flavofungini]|uniref:hypothetical protein n=1 Tax=Streptomyces flavofungini TaxID=68200 RepID=UPI0025AF24AD|nr:hypothetical protein [Streptomyces flavofungini]WJV51633.1 hypothetical protein QUY26_15180 [Streptomyces flavofungini]
MNRPARGRPARDGAARAREVAVAAGATAGVLASVLLLTGCAQSVDPIERLGRKAAEKIPRKVPHELRRAERWCPPGVLGTLRPGGTLSEGVSPGLGPGALPRPLVTPPALALRLTEC